MIRQKKTKIYWFSRVFFINSNSFSSVFKIATKRDRK